MDYTRQRDWFDPSKVNASVTIVGCGGIGSFTALALAKLGVRAVKLVDFDTVDEHNVPNQLYTVDQIGAHKVNALRDTIYEHTGISAKDVPYSLDVGVPLSDVVVSALDSMETRADLWKQVKNNLGVKLFLDARLGGEHIVLYSVNPSRPTDIEGYEATLHSDDEGIDLPCTGRSIIDVGFAVGSLITRAVRKHYAHEPMIPTVYLNQSTLDIFKGGWAS
jgi:hypothetical protein